MWPSWPPRTLVWLTHPHIYAHCTRGGAATRRDVCGGRSIALVGWTTGNVVDLRELSRDKADQLTRAARSRDAAAVKAAMADVNERKSHAKDE